MLSLSKDYKLTMTVPESGFSEYYLASIPLRLAEIDPPKSAV